LPLGRVQELPGSKGCAMTTPVQELAAKVLAYVSATCPPPPGNLEWRHYLTGDGANDRPVLEAVARGLDITVWELLARAEGRQPPDAPVFVAPPRVKAKRVAARYRRECVGGERC
jgi:hypothetical protein